MGFSRRREAMMIPITTAAAVVALLRTFGKFQDRPATASMLGGWGTCRSRYMKAVSAAISTIEAIPTDQATREAVFWLIVTILSPPGLERKGGTGSLAGVEGRPVRGVPPPGGQ